MSDITEPLQKKSNAGRPKGTKDSKPRITQADIQKAHMMYITGSTVTQIAKALKIKSLNSIYKHMDVESWEKDKEEYSKKKQENYLAAMMEKAKKEADQVLDDIKVIKGAAMEGIQNVDPTKVRLGEATQSYLSATELERRVQSEGVELGFVSIVGKVLKEIIQDPKILAQIADRLKVELDHYRGRPLLQKPEIKIEEENG